MNARGHFVENVSDPNVRAVIVVESVAAKDGNVMTGCASGGPQGVKIVPINI